MVLIVGQMVIKKLLTVRALLNVYRKILTISRTRR